MKEKIIQIYSGKPEDFVWVGFGSGSGTNLEAWAKVIPPAAIFTDKPTAKIKALEEFRHTLILELNGYQFCGSWEKAQGNPEAETEYYRKAADFNEMILEGLRDLENDLGKPIDLIVLGGYMRLIQDPLLSAYPDRMINVHPANLNCLDFYNNSLATYDNPKDILDVKIHELTEKGAIKAKRKYIGADAVYDAIKAGETATKSSVIIVDRREDHGEILIQGPKVDVWMEFLDGTEDEKQESLREYTDAHQSFQKVRSDWPALTTALELIAKGRLALGTEKVHFREWRQVYVDGEPLGFRSYQVGSN